MQAPGTWLHNRLTLDFRHGRPWDGNIKLPRHLRRAFFFDLTYPWEAVRWRKKYLHEADVARVYAGELPPLDGKVGEYLMSPTLRGLGLMSIGPVDLGFGARAQWLDGPTRGLRILTIHEIIEEVWSLNVVKQFWQQFEVLPGKLIWFT